MQIVNAAKDKYKELMKDADNMNIPRDPAIDFAIRLQAIYGTPEFEALAQLIVPQLEEKLLPREESLPGSRSTPSGGELEPVVDRPDSSQPDGHQQGQPDVRVGQVGHQQDGHQHPPPRHAECILPARP